MTEAHRQILRDTLHREHLHLMSRKLMSHTCEQLQGRLARLWSMRSTRKVDQWLAVGCKAPKRSYNYYADLSTVLAAMHCSTAVPQKLTRLTGQCHWADSPPASSAGLRSATHERQKYKTACLLERNELSAEAAVFKDSRQCGLLAVDRINKVHSH
jgi:hypothetical protein